MAPILGETRWQWHGNNTNQAKKLGKYSGFHGMFLPGDISSKRRAAQF
jgi:hypothetical protein